MSASATEDSAHDLLEDQAASQWLKTALRGALERDPVDALNDAFLLAGALEKRLKAVLEL